MCVRCYRGVNAFFGRVKMGRVKDGTHLSSVYTEMMGWKSVCVLVKCVMKEILAN